MANTMNRPCVRGCLSHTGGAGQIKNAELHLVSLERGQSEGGKRAAHEEQVIAKVLSDAEGRFSFPAEDCAPGEYIIRVLAFGKSHDHKMTIEEGIIPEVHVKFPLEYRLSMLSYTPEGSRTLPVLHSEVGKHVVVHADLGGDPQFETIRWTPPHGAASTQLTATDLELMPGRSGTANVVAALIDKHPNYAGSHAEASTVMDLVVSNAEVQAITGHVGVTLERTKSDPTLDQALWVAIRNRTHAINFHNYRRFIDRMLAWDENQRLPEQLERRLRDLGAHMHGVGAYQVLKMATETFLLLECGVRIPPQDRLKPAFDPGEELYRLGEPFTRSDMELKLSEYLGQPSQLPYITRVVEAAFPDFEREGFSGRLITARINQPCLIELIWNYWHEEGMLMQTLNAISLRFQNVRVPGERDPLANVEIDPLRPLNNLLWGYIQDEINRLSVKRRAYEYLHQYGLALFGRATPGVRPADNRSKFLEAFHNLLYQASVFYEKDFQTTVIADGFPLLNSLQEVHLVLAQGAHNQFGDLPWTARTEMLLAEYILARPEIRDFLQSRAMVPYKEAWMPQVDAMKSLQNWSDVTVTYFRDLGVYGEQLLLSIRYADWIHVNNEDSAKNWARYWRPEIQGYLHAYRAVTGIDLTNPDTVDATLPAIHLQKRIVMQHQRMR